LIVSKACLFFQIDCDMFFLFKPLQHFPLRSLPVMGNGLGPISYIFFC